MKVGELKPPTDEEVIDLIRSLPPHYAPKDPTPPDVIAEDLSLGHIRDHGDPSTWRYLGKKVVPATELGRLPGSQKVYEAYFDENGRQIEWHYWVNPDGTIDGGKLVYPGTTDRSGLSQ